MSMEQVMIDFYNGARMLQMLAAWAYVEANRSLVLDQVTSFAEAYEKLVQLHAEGKLGAAGDFSRENLERVERLAALIQAGLDTDEARSARQELHDLAERCLQGLIVQPEAPPSSDDS